MRKPNIVHILENGKRVKSIEGYIVPTDNPVYEIMLRSYKKDLDREATETTK